jgi:hypothetical protein
MRTGEDDYYAKTLAEASAAQIEAGIALAEAADALAEEEEVKYVSPRHPFQSSHRRIALTT